MFIASHPTKAFWRSEERNATWAVLIQIRSAPPNAARGWGLAGYKYRTPNGVKDFAQKAESKRRLEYRIQIFSRG
jgi:hypothetical protein